MTGYPAWWSQTENELLNETLDSVDGKWDKREGGFMYDALSAYTKLRAASREELKTTLSMHFAMEATGEMLDKVVATRSPLTRFQAKYAYGIVKVKGNPHTKLPADTRYMSIVYNDGQEPIEFSQLEDITIGNEGVAYVTVRCLQIGEAGNIPANSIEIASPIIGVASVINEQDFDNGAEREDDETFRDRYFRWLREMGSSGNVADYIKWSLEVQDVGSVVVTPLWNGRGTVKLSLVDKEFQPANRTIIDAAIHYICPVSGEGHGKAPIGATVTIAPAETVEVNIVANVLLKDGANLMDIRQTFQENAMNYFLELNQAGWTPTVSPEVYILNYLKIGALLVETDGIRSVNQLLMNGSTSNIEAHPGQVFVLKEVVLAG